MNLLRNKVDNSELATIPFWSSVIAIIAFLEYIGRVNLVLSAKTGTDIHCAIEQFKGHLFFGVFHVLLITASGCLLISVYRSSWSPAQKRTVFYVASFILACHLFSFAGSEKFFYEMYIIIINQFMEYGHAGYD